jgi:hypothetical protein
MQLQEFANGAKVSSVRAGYRQVIDVLAIEVENAFRSSNGRSVLSSVHCPKAEAHKVEKVDPSMKILESALTYARDKNLERRAVADERELMRDCAEAFDGGSKIRRDKRKIRKADSVR